MQEEKGGILSDECKNYRKQNKEKVERYLHEAHMEGRRVRISEQMVTMEGQEKKKEEYEEIAKEQEKQFRDWEKRAVSDEELARRSEEIERKRKMLQRLLNKISEICR